MFLLCVSSWALPQALLGQTAAQEPTTGEAEEPTLANRGEPIVVPLKCDYEDLLNAGMVCNEDTPCRLYLDLVAVYGMDEFVFVLGNIHSSGGTVSSILLASDDQGVTWREAAERIPGGSLERTLFVSGTHGWIAGQRWEGTTQAYPFLLLTDNGGARWEKRELWEQDSDRSGVVSTLGFENDESGFLVVERLSFETDPFELYETRNGGRSWTIREITSDQPEIPIRRAISHPPLWRLRAGRGRGAHMIEKACGR